MTDFNKQLLNLDGTPAEQGEVSVDKETGKKKTIKHPLTLLRCAKFALLDVPKYQTDSMGKLFDGYEQQKRWKLWQKINKSPDSVDITKEEKDILAFLLPLKFEVQAVGQIMDILDEV